MARAPDTLMESERLSILMVAHRTCPMPLLEEDVHALRDDAALPDSHLAENWPVVLPLGVLEYHGEHMAVGMDTLAVIKALELLEGGMDLVILPPFYYSAASHAVAPS